MNGMNQHRITVYAVRMTLLSAIISFLAVCTYAAAVAADIPCGNTYKSKRRGEVIRCGVSRPPAKDETDRDSAQLPGFTPPPTPVSEPKKSGPKDETIDLACSTYSLPNRDTANSSQLDQANKIRAYCTLVLTWWSSLPRQTWCPYILHNSTVKHCGPYDNYGYMDSRNDPGGWNLAGDIYNKYVLPKLPQCPLKNSSGQVAYNPFINWEVDALQKGNPECVDFFMDYFEQVPESVYNGKWKGTYTDRKWNLRFLDNFYVWGTEWYWNNAPSLSRDQQEKDALAGAKRVRERADAIGVKLFANIWNDVESEYFKRPVYPELMDIVDYALFEVFTSKYSTGTPESEAVWQRRVKTAQAINKDRKATAVIGTDYGDYWYNLASGLLACEPGKCMFWQQPLPPDSVLAKVSNLDLGTPGSDYTKAGCYLRPWTNGLVIVNPMDSGSCSVPLSGSYKDLETGSTVSGTVTVKMKDGKVLVRE